jgi:hypothetical protein
MARFSIAGRSTVVGTTVRAVASLFSVASRTLKVREVGITNTTSTAVAAALCRFTNATGVGAGLTEVQYDEASPAPNGTGFAGHTADGAVGSNFRYASLGAAVGSGMIWTFGDTGYLIAAGTANGIGIICPTGTGQILDYWIDWDE